MKKTLLGSVSAAVLLISSAAFADGNGNSAGTSNNVNVGSGSSQTVVGDNSGNSSTTIDNSGNLAINNTNLGNTGLIAGQDNNVLSGNEAIIVGNNSGNTNYSSSTETGSVNIDESTNVTNSADFSDASGYVTGNVLNAQVASTNIEFSPDGATINGNSITSTANSAAGIVMATQAGPNTTFSNTTNSVSVNVGTIN